MFFDISRKKPHSWWLLSLPFKGRARGEVIGWKGMDLTKICAGNDLRKEIARSMMAILLEMKTIKRILFLKK
jgi:hypothetical protein